MTSSRCKGESFDNDDDDAEVEDVDDDDVADDDDAEREPGFQNLSGIGSAIPALLLFILLTAE